MRLLASNRRILFEWAIVSLLALTFVAWAVRGDWLTRVDNLVYDQLIRSDQRPAGDEIIIVAIDDESVGRLGRWPWDRRVHAALIDRLASARPAAIVYDVLFVDPSPADDRLAAAMARAGPIIPLYMEVPGRDGAPVSIVPPVEPIRSAAHAIGHVNLSPDIDGVVRRVNLAEGTAGQLWPHLAALAACKIRKQRCDLPATTSDGRGFVRIADYRIPYSGGPQHFRSIPFAEVLRGGVPPSFFDGKFVLVGATATGLRDSYATPLGRTGVLVAGVEINAHILQGLLDRTIIRDASLFQKLALALAPLVLLLAGFLIATPRTNLLLGLFLGLLVMLVTTTAFVTTDLWLPPSAALAGLVAVFPIWGWRRLVATSAYMREEMQRFRADPEILTLDRARAGERVESEIDLLRRTIAGARELQHFVSDTLKGLPDASLVVAPDGKIRLLNDRARLLVGDAVGSDFRTALALLDDNLLENIASTPGHGALPAEIEGPSGRTFSTLWSPIRDAQESLVCWVLRLADITDLKVAERQREEVLQLLTHDMRSPQAAIIAALSQSRGSMNARLANRIEGYARRTLALADGFVQLARADAQQLTLETLDLRDLMIEAVDDLWPLSQARSIKVETVSGDSEVLVRGDRGLLGRALINLVSNAIKYGPEGSTVECQVKVRKQMAVFTVRDEGNGVPANLRSSLFKPFERGRDDREGVGLGLAFVKSVANRHNGEATYRGGKVSRFDLLLPLA